MVTLRHTRYQAAIIRDGSILLVRCAFRNGPSVWMLPGGGREEDEDDAACVAREVLEETGLIVGVGELLADTPAQPADGTYVRWRTYRCEVLGGDAVLGGGEGPNADLVDIRWFQLQDDRSWPDEIRGDPFLFPQLQAIRHDEHSRP